eukprot:TRINITY_DN10395_c0_g1_i1.p1 TRINITY_DN10395_c0_g1~~TRINITY_DN10395_c0_g1_i1.p1  ORF type:complete len:432 (-),score=26.91 TRINITY_DN10395_c0_g1_i1:263-1558(-)
MTEEQKPLLDVAYRVYWQRWWIMLWYSLFTTLQSCIYVTYNPIAGPTKNLYHVSDSTVNFLALLGPFTAVPTMFPVSWLLLRKGLRVSMIVFGLIVAAGAAVRILARGPHTFYWVIIGQVLNGLAGPVSLIAVTQISALWFHPNERTLATSVTSNASWLGSAIGFLTGLFVTTEKGLKMLVYWQSGVAGLIAIVLIAYFPSKPPTPPAPSQEEDMKAQPQSYLVILKGFATNARFLFIVFLSGATGGIYNGWITLADVTLGNLGWTQEQAAYLSFISIVAGTIVSCLLAKFADVFKGKFKIMLISLFFLSAVCFLCFTLSIKRIIPYNYWVVLTLGVLGGVFVVSTGPLCYEYVVELTYPLPEATSAAVLSGFSNLVNIGFVYVADYASPILVDWLTTACFGLFGFALLFFKDDYRRLRIDAKSTNPPTVQ